jgi:hypothetical protein
MASLEWWWEKMKEDTSAHCSQRPVSGISARGRHFVVAAQAENWERKMSVDSYAETFEMRVHGMFGCLPGQCIEFHVPDALA